jgi:hypothetical protein
MSSVNPTGRIANANAGIEEGQKKTVTAEQNMQQVVSGGPGSAASTRHELFLAKSLTGLMREISQFWLQEASEEQKAMRQLRLGDNKDVATA